MGKSKTKLLLLSLYDMVVDGVWGSASKLAAKSFQRRIHLYEDILRSI